MANKDNLIPLNRRSKEAAKEIQTAGGKARGKQQQEAKTFREAALVMLKVPQDFKLPNGETLRATARDGVVLGMLQAAQRGNPKAAKWLADILGESSININLTTDDDMRPEINIE